MHFCFVQFYWDLLILLNYDYTSRFKVIVIFMCWYLISTRYRSLPNLAKKAKIVSEHLYCTPLQMWPTASSEQFIMMQHQQRWYSRFPGEGVKPYHGLICQSVPDNRGWSLHWGSYTSPINNRITVTFSFMIKFSFYMMLTLLSLFTCSLPLLVLMSSVSLSLCCKNASHFLLGLRQYIAIFIFTIFVSYCDPRIVIHIVLWSSFQSPALKVSNTIRTLTHFIFKLLISVYPVKVQECT